MAILASVYIEGTITDTQGFVTDIATIPINNSSGVISHNRLVLLSGTNTILIPSGARGVIITFSADANLKTWKGLAGDTGIAMSASGAKTFILSIPVGPGASFIINSAALDVGFSEFFFF